MPVEFGRGVGSSAVLRTAAKRAKRSTCPHAFNQNLRGFGPHDPRVGQHACTQFLPQLAAANRHLLVALRSALIDQADATQLLVKGREAYLDRLDLEIAFELVEFALRRQTVPDVLAVVERRVG